MEKELDPEVIKLTQISLGKYVKRPPLNEKLLKKPPFRFLHDVITTVLKTTGFFENLFDEEELVSDNVKDRDSKISFLNKVIFVLGSTTGKSISAKPSKIVAGQEPDKTNELLQCLAQALDEKLSSAKAVKQYKDNLKQHQPTESKIKDASKSIKKGNDTKKLNSRSSEKLVSSQRNTTKQDKEKPIDTKSKRKENGPTKGEIQAKKLQQSKTIIKKDVRKQTELIKDDDITQTHTKSLTPKPEKETFLEGKDKLLNTVSKVLNQDSDVTVEREDHSDQKSNIREDTTISNKEDSVNFKNDNLQDSSIFSDDLIETSHVNTVEKITIDNNDNKINDDQNESANMKTENLKSLESEAKPEKININKAVIPETENKTIDTDNHEPLNIAHIPVTSGNDMKMPRPHTVRPSSVRPSSSRPGAPRMREKVDTVIKDTDNLLMGKVNIITESAYNEEEEDASLIIMDQGEAIGVSQEQQDLQVSSNEHGHLVQQILDSQKELSHISGKTEIEWQFGAQKAREAMNQDIEQLRFNIQALSRVANPLGKLLDHIQEDVEVMRQELQQWSNIYEEVNKEMLKQKTTNEDSLTPFHTKLKQLRADIEEKRDKIDDLKILIHKNATRIDKLLTSGNVQ